METLVRIPVIMQAREVLSPYGDKPRGYRIAVAVPNMAGQFFGQECPSFQKPYLIEEDGDYETYEVLLAAIEIVTKRLEANGYAPRLLGIPDPPEDPEVKKQRILSLAETLSQEVEVWRQKLKAAGLTV